jgi:hypothetical protein
MSGPGWQVRSVGAAAWVREEGRHHRIEGAMRERRPKGWSASVGNRAPMNGPSAA